MDHPKDAVKEVLDWLLFIETEFKEMMPQSGGGETGAAARRAIEAIKMLVEQDH